MRPLAVFFLALGLTILWQTYSLAEQRHAFTTPAYLPSPSDLRFNFRSLMPEPPAKNPVSQPGKSFSAYNLNRGRTLM